MKVPGMWGFIGVDPGVTSGIAWATYTRYAPGPGYKENGHVWDVHAASCDPEGMLFILVAALGDFNRLGVPVLMQGEKFLTTRGAGSRGPTRT